MQHELRENSMEIITGQETQLAKMSSSGSGDPSVNLMSQFQDYLVNGAFTDMSVSVLQRNVKYTIRCHRLVLASSSPFLAEMLCQYNQEDDEATLIFTDISNDELELLISFLYSGFVTFTTSCAAQRLKALLNHLGVRQFSIMEEDDLSSLIATEDFAHLTSSTVDQSAILYEFQSAFHQPINNPNATDHQEDVNKILEEIISDYDKSSRPKEVNGCSFGMQSSVEPTSKKNRRSKVLHNCSQCPKSFPSGHYLKFHVSSVHSKMKSVLCDLCSKPFSGDYYLRQHIKRMHSSVRPFVCDKCSASFSVKYDLVVHSRTHIKRFACESCSKAYATQRALKEHSRTHTGEKPYQCSLCKKCFALPKTLRVHFRQHSGERPYLCSHCGMTFVQNSTLKNHLKTNHDIKQ